MTYQFDSRKVGKVTYMDTPGLQDIKMRKQAAEAISTALKQDGKYQVVFVVTVESGRIRPEDVAVIKLVLDSAKEITWYGVIFNKLSKGVMRGIEENEENKKALITEVSLGTIGRGKRRPIPIPLFLPVMKELNDENDATTKIPKLEEFMNTIPKNVIRKANVIDVQIDKYEKQIELLEAQINELKQNEEKLISRMEQDRIDFEEQIKNLMEEEKRKFDEQISAIKEDKMTEQGKKELEKYLEQVLQQNEKLMVYFDKYMKGYGIMDFIKRTIDSWSSSLFSNNVEKKPTVVVHSKPEEKEA